MARWNDNHSRPPDLRNMQFVGLGTTIAAVPQRAALRAICVQEGDTVPPASTGDFQKLFKIRLAATEGHREAASFLVKRRYAWRGYDVHGIDAKHPNRITLSACDDEDNMIATISVGLDSFAGLFVDTLYRDEIDLVRAENGQVCEFTKLAIDARVKSKPVLAALFHIAFIYARKLKGCTDLFVEVNPRHVLFYKQMLGFTECGSRRYDSRVDAPAVLMRLRLGLAEQYIAEMGGRPEVAETKRSLYPFFFSRREEEGISRRLRELD